MKKFLVIFLTVVFTAGFVLFTGCGGGTKVNSAADEEGQVMDEASQKSKEELPTTYLVEAGDTLATIAEKAGIYGNKYQWPLIFDANKDILDDYKKIQEGQKLIIPRNVSAVEIEAAKQRAEELNWPASEGKTASKGREAEEDNGEVAGISRKSSGQAAGNAASGQDSSADEGAEMATDEQPTPIPEPGKNAKKKGGPNMMMLLLILLGVIAVVVWFMMSQKKKKDEEEDKEDKSDNILG